MAHDSTQIINELKRSRAEFEEETWRPDLDLDSLRDSVPGSKRAMLANASKLFLELQSQVRDRIAELRERDERERQESRRIAMLHPIAWPESPKEREAAEVRPETKEEETRSQSVTTPGTPETVVSGPELSKASECTPSLSPLKEGSMDSNQANSGKQLIFASGNKANHDVAHMPPIVI